MGCDDYPLLEAAVPQGLRERLVLALMEALVGSDPLVTIAVGNNRVNVSWGDDNAPRQEVKSTIKDKA